MCNVVISKIRWSMTVCNKRSVAHFTVQQESSAKCVQQSVPTAQTIAVAPNLTLLVPMVIRHGGGVVITLALALSFPRFQRVSAFSHQPLRPATGVGSLRYYSSSPYCSMSSGGPIVLGSKSFTRKAILEEMSFTPIIRCDHVVAEAMR